MGPLALSVSWALPGAAFGRPFCITNDKINQMPELIRLNKFLADHTNLARRKADAAIASGQVLVNNQLATIGQKINPGYDVVTWQGRIIAPRTAGPILIAFNKPAGVTTTRRDPHAKQTPYDFLPPNLQRLNPIGRLDRDSTGLLLMTNDGQLAQTLSHPSHDHDKQYEVTVKLPADTADTSVSSFLHRLQTTIVDPAAQTQPIKILASHYRPARAELRATVLLYEGRNREIRRLFAVLNGTVTRLHRTRVGPYRLGNLQPGRYRYLQTTTPIN